ncbi:unnamed protein product [Clonostachys rosea f. rosea IK726]|jgi:choline transport protein|uniref:Amino acid permease/ SLC12A domain-containing protein n=2 Tax=Bionectria ochroleuca TaxID=29856 RepID=A0A0B7K367_BIOOC|nr:unnamed protein product [Clonostachys rosea f. rosea IK726]
MSNKAKSEEVRPASSTAGEVDVLKPEIHEEKLAKRYSPLSVIAFAFTTTNSWVAFSSTLAAPLICGGSPTLIYGLIGGGIIMSIIGIGFAELASAFPSAGGQYHIVYMVFPPSLRRGAAFFAGWLSIIYIAAALASCNIFVSNSILYLVSIWESSYEIQAWHTYLLHIALCVAAFFATSRFPGAIGRIGIAVFWLSLIGFVASMAAILSVSKTKQTSSFVFKDFQNVSGWNDGWSVVLGITGCLWAYSGVDAATHVAEEVKNPSRTVPTAIFLSLGLGIITVVAWNIAIMFSITDLDALLSSEVAVLEVYSQALNNKAAVTIFGVYYIVMFYTIVLNLFIFGGRTFWSLSRDGGVPYSKYFVHLQWASPVRATFVMLVLEIVLGVLYVASTTAYNSFVNLTLFALNITVAMPQACLLFRGRACLPERAFSLGKYGFIVNALATLSVIFFSITFSFPPEMPVTGSSMNYLIVVMAVGVVFIAAIWWGGLRKTFTGPLGGHLHGFDH